MKRTYFLVLLFLCLLGCSSDDNEGPKAYFPVEMVVGNTDGSDVTSTYSLTYNAKNLITVINIERSSGMSTSDFRLEIAYNSSDVLEEIRTIGEDSESVVRFTRDLLGFLTEIEITDVEETTFLEVNIDPFNNEYTIDGLYAILPITLGFDDANVLEYVVGPNVNERIIEYDPSQEGSFANVRPQPLLLIFFEIFTFGIDSEALSYMSPILTTFVNYDDGEDIEYQNFERDEAGNLISFEHPIGAVSRRYSVSYQFRNL